MLFAIFHENQIELLHIIAVMWYIKYDHGHSHNWFLSNSKHFQLFAMHETLKRNGCMNSTLQMFHYQVYLCRVRQVTGNKRPPPQIVLTKLGCPRQKVMHTWLTSSPTNLDSNQRKSNFTGIQFYLASRIMLVLARGLQDAPPELHSASSVPRRGGRQAIFPIVIAMYHWHEALFLNINTNYVGILPVYILR